MILFVFEGKKREPEIFSTIRKLFLDEKVDIMTCSWEDHLYSLYSELNRSEDFPEDTVTILRNRFKNDPTNSIGSIKYSSDISEIYLFFDFDGKSTKNLKETNLQLQKMLRFFNDETSGQGKMYINYPMVESILFVKRAFPDNDFWRYTYPLKDTASFKSYVHNECYYKNLDAITFKANKRTHLITKEPSEKESITKKENWRHLIRMNVRKANYLCTGKLELPDLQNTEISQEEIFTHQKENYLEPKEEISVLNAFPLFIYDYTKWKDKLLNAPNQ